MKDKASIPSLNVVCEREVARLTGTVIPQSTSNAVLFRFAHPDVYET